MGYPEKLARGGYIPPHPKPEVKRKYVKVVEIRDENTYELQPGQRIIDQRIIHEVVELRQPKVFDVNRAFPAYKTVIVLECVEFEYD